MSEVAYLDSSALVKLALVEEDSEALRCELRSWPRRVTSRLAVVEVLRAVRREDAAREPLARGILTRVALVAMSDSILAEAVQLAPAKIRSLDAIHLATALRVGDDIAAFVSYDKRQLEAADALGLPVASPH